MSKPRFSIVLPIFAGASALDFRLNTEHLAQTAKIAEGLGFDSLWVPDHLSMGKGGEILEAWTVLSAISQHCHRMHLGGLVLCATHRSPALLAKMSATLDVMTCGRLELGIGAGWRGSEQRSYGLPWNSSARVRVEQLCETIEILKGMWTNESFSFTGKHYKVQGAVCLPRPIQKPHPNIIIGGAGEKLVLKAVAMYGNGWNVGTVSPEEFAHKLDVLRMHCDSVGTKFKNIEPSMDVPILITEKNEELEQVMKWSSWFATIQTESNFMKAPTESLQDMKEKYILGNVSEARERIRDYMQAGVQHFMFECLDYPSGNTMRLLAEEVLPSLGN